MSGVKIGDMRGHRVKMMRETSGVSIKEGRRRFVGVSMYWSTKPDMASTAHIEDVLMNAARGQMEVNLFGLARMVQAHIGVDDAEAGLWEERERHLD